MIVTVTRTLLGVITVQTPLAFVMQLPSTRFSSVSFTVTRARIRGVIRPTSSMTRNWRKNSDNAFSVSLNNSSRPSVWLRQL